jgi:hypothetical protein
MLCSVFGRFSRAVIGASLALALVVSAAGCGRGHRRSAADTSPHAQSAARSGGSTAVLPADQAAALEMALVSARPAVAESALARPVRAAALKRRLALLPAGSQLSIAAARMRVTGQIATVPATVTGPSPGGWLLLLINESGQWRVYGARKTS